MPSIQVLPVGNGADVQTAKTLKGIVRHIEQASHARHVRQQAFDSAVRIGMGYYRIVLEYDDWMSFDREPRLAGIRNPFMVYLDPGAQCPVGSDAEWAFLFEHQDKASFQDEWGIESRSMDLWATQGDTWIQKDFVRIAEYFWKDKQRMTLAQFRDGSVQLLEPLLLQALAEFDLPNPRKLQEFIGNVLLTPRPPYAPLLPWMQRMVQTAPAWLDGLPSDFVGLYSAWLNDLVGQIQQVRPTVYETVRWIKTNGYAILEESVWPGKWIPILRIVGEELDINNRVQRSGIVRYAKDPMRMENYWMTMQAEHIALSPVPPWLVADGQLEGYEQLWQKANRVPFAYLTYKPISLQGQVLGPPTRNTFEPPIQAITIAQQSTQQYSQNAMGIHLTNVGAQGQKERSGKAIIARDQQADTGSYHYVDNLAQAMQFEGEQLVDLIPKVLTPGKIQRILGDDGSPQMVALFNSQVQQTPEQAEGLAGVYDLATGTYDARVDVGPSFETKRQEAAANMKDMFAAAPEAFSALLWKFLSLQDWDGAQELADLAKKLPGQILDDAPGTNKDMQLAQLQQQVPQLMMQIQQLTGLQQQAQAALAQLADENKSLKEGHDLKAREIELKYQVEREKAKLQHVDTEIRAYAELGRAHAQRQQMAIQRERHEFAMAHEGEDDDAADIYGTTE